MVTQNLNDPDISNFLTNTQKDRELQNENLIHSLVKDMKSDLNNGNEKSKRYYFIKDSINQYKNREILYRAFPY